MSEWKCEDCGGPMADGGPCGWYCEAGTACPGHEKSWKEAVAAVQAMNPSKQDYDALVARVAEMEAESQQHYCMAVAMYFSARVASVTVGDLKAAAAHIKQMIADNAKLPPTAPADGEKHGG